MCGWFLRGPGDPTMTSDGLIDCPNPRRCRPISIRATNLNWVCANLARGPLDEWLTGFQPQLPTCRTAQMQTACRARPGRKRGLWYALDETTWLFGGFCYEDWDYTVGFFLVVLVRGVCFDCDIPESLLLD